MTLNILSFGHSLEGTLWFMAALSGLFLPHLHLILVLSYQDIMKKKLEIQKQKQELLNKQIQQQKVSGKKMPKKIFFVAAKYRFIPAFISAFLQQLLIAKLEKKNLTASEKEAIMKVK